MVCLVNGKQRQVQAPDNGLPQSRRLNITGYSLWWEQSNNNKRRNPAAGHSFLPGLLLFFVRGGDFGKCRLSGELETALVIDG
jgi:hypothetical protein